MKKNISVQDAISMYSEMVRESERFDVGDITSYKCTSCKVYTNAISTSKGFKPEFIECSNCKLKNSALVKSHKNDKTPKTELYRLPLYDFIMIRNDKEKSNLFEHTLNSGLLTRKI